LKLLPKILPSEEEEDRRLDHRKPAAAEAEPELPSLNWGWTAALAAAAAIPRLLYLFVFSDPENPGLGVYDDVWHHWQIAYLTKEVGLTAAGGPRLWDLKGLEYVWGPIHPLLMVAVFAVTGSVDIVLNRLVSLVFGVVVVVLVFHLCRRYWGTQVAIAAALFATLLPTSVMTDASGMVEPLAVALSLLGLWAWSRGNGFWSGVALALAAVARAEEWIFSSGLSVAAWLGRRSWQRYFPLVAGFAAVMLVYMKVLLDRTGNPIYPFYWNFFGVAGGQWGAGSISASQESVRPFLIALLVASLIGLAWTLWKRPASYMLLTFGFGYWVFITGTYGLTAALSGWQWWIPFTRRFEFPVLFAAVLLVVLALSWAPRRFGKKALAAGWIVTGATLVGAQLAWLPIAEAFGPTEAPWRASMADSRQLGAWYNRPPYVGHALAVPADRPDITYGLARFGGVEGKHLVSEMYDPFSYLPAGHRFADSQAAVSTLVACWLGDTDTRMIAFRNDNANYGLLLGYNPSWFVRLGSMTATGWTVVGVSAPRPSAADCRAARDRSLT
jgi:hypothetical protein